MSLYALVEEGVVVSTGAIPVVFRNIGGFHLIQDDAIYKSHGFLPYTYTAPEFDTWTQTLGDYIYTITEDDVSGTRAVVAIQPGALEAQKLSYVKNITAMLNDVLYSTDWAFSPYADLEEEQVNAYSALRSSILRVRPLLKNLAIQELGGLVGSIAAQMIDFKDRLADFSESMIEFKSIMDSIGV